MGDTTAAQAETSIPREANHPSGRTKSPCMSITTSAAEAGSHGPRMGHSDGSAATLSGPTTRRRERTEG